MICGLFAILHNRSISGALDWNASFLTVDLVNIVSTRTEARVVTDKILASSFSTVHAYAVICVATPFVAIFLCAQVITVLACACVCWRNTDLVNTNAIRPTCGCLAIVYITALHIGCGGIEVPGPHTFHVKGRGRTGLSTIGETRQALIYRSLTIFENFATRLTICVQ
jgi:hypothetical protein